MEISEAIQLRQLDEQERLAWQLHLETKSPASFDAISDCVKKKARIYGATWPDAPTVKLVKKGKSE